MRKKLLVIGMISSMVLSFAACGDKGTTTESTTAASGQAVQVQDSGALADELLGGLTQIIKDNTGKTINMKIDMKMDMSMSAGETQISAVSTTTGEMAYSTNVSYMSTVTDVDLGEAGGKQTQEQKSYRVNDNGKVTVYNYKEGKWEKQEGTAEDEKSPVEMFSKDAFKSVEVTESDTEYVVSGPMDMTKMGKNISGMGLGSATQGATDVTLTITFDKGTKQFKTIKMAFADMEANGMTLKNTYFTIENAGFTDGEISVPNDIQ